MKRNENQPPTPTTRHAETPPPCTIVTRPKKQPNTVLKPPCPGPSMYVTGADGSITQVPSPHGTPQAIAPHPSKKYGWGVMANSSSSAA